MKKKKKPSLNQYMLTNVNSRKLTKNSKKFSITKSLFIQLALENYFNSEQFKKDMESESRKNRVFVENE